MHGKRSAGLRPVSFPQVQRAKKCLDFAGTILVLHLLAVTCFNGFPKQAPWYVVCSI